MRVEGMNGEHSKMPGRTYQTWVQGYFRRPVTLTSEYGRVKRPMAARTIVQLEEGRLGSWL